MGVDGKQRAKDWRAARRNAPAVARICAKCGGEYLAAVPRYCPPCHAANESERYHRTKHLPEKAEARRAKHLKQTYDLSVEEYEALLAQQNGVCAICHQSQSYARLHVDHDHVTGAIRSLLCLPCNALVGRLERNEDLVAPAVAYLASWKSAPVSCRGAQ